VRLLPVLVLGIAAVGGMFAGTWTSGAILSTGGEGWESASAIDAAGNSVAVWDERTTNGLVIDRVWARSRSAAGLWAPHAIVSPTAGSLQTTYVFPSVHVSAAGNATAIWSDVAGVWTADRAVRGAWGPAQLLVPGVSQPYFVMNNPGDMILVWLQGAGPRGTPNSVIALRRPAGGVWGTPENVITAPHVGANHVALGDNGDAVISWETYDAACTTEKCTLSNFVQHASRETAPAAGWQDSGALAGPDQMSHLGFVAVNAAGYAGMILEKSTSTFVSITQAGSGQPWSAPAPVYAGTNPYAVGFGCDVAGNATLLLQEMSATAVIAVSGNIPANSWSAPAVISGRDPSPNQVIFAVGANGAAVAVWAAGNPNYTNNAIRATVRDTAKGTWKAPVTLAKTSLGGPESVAVGVNGQAVITFATFTALWKHAEYAVNYKP
jgi:hypothetical protein